MSTWWKHFGKGQLAVIAVRDSAGRLVAVAPFYIARSFTGLGARRPGFLADEHVGSDYLNVLADARFAAAAVEEIARILFAHHRLWDYIELRDTADSPLTAALTARLCAATFRCRPTSRNTWPVSARACGPITGAGAALSSANIKRNAWPFRRRRIGTALPCTDCIASHAVRTTRGGERIPGAGSHRVSRRGHAGSGGARVRQTVPAQSRRRRRGGALRVLRGPDVSVLSVWDAPRLGPVRSRAGPDRQRHRANHRRRARHLRFLARRRILQDAVGGSFAREHYAALLRPAASQRRRTMESPDFRGRAQRRAHRQGAPACAPGRPRTAIADSPSRNLIMG